jgi:ribosomal protein S18 acetylase RimI-like enzyme
MNKDELIIRAATFEDITFLSETIIEAEKAGTDKLPYYTIFGLTEEESKRCICEMLMEGIDNCELSVSSFLVAEINHRSIGALAAWIEEYEGIPSGVLKGNLLKANLPRDSIHRAMRMSNTLNELHFDPVKGAIQIGAGYVIKEYRGNDILGILINESIKRLIKISPDVSAVYDHVFEMNKPALRTDEKLGFVKVRTKESLKEEITAFLPYKKKLLMRKELGKNIDFIFRNATVNDVPFLVSTIIEAEKSGTGTLSYSSVFGLTEDEARKYIEAMLLEETDGCELSVSSFIIAETDGETAGAVASWVEGVNGIPSIVLKGNLLNSVLPERCIKTALRVNHLLEELHIDNKTGSIQIGLVYVVPAFRGYNLARKLIDASVISLVTGRENVSEVYIQVFGNNLPAIKAYEKADFRIVMKKESHNKEILKYLPSISKVLMKKTINY